MWVDTQKCLGGVGGGLVVGWVGLGPGDENRAGLQLRTIPDVGGGLVLMVLMPTEK